MCSSATWSIHAQSCPPLCDPMDCSPPDSCPWDFPGKNNAVGCHFLLQGIFQTQGSNLHFLQLLHCQADFYYCAIWESLLPCDFHLLGQCCMSTLYYKGAWGIDVDFSCIHWHHEPSGVLWKNKDRFLPGSSIWHQNYSWENENWSSVKHWRKSMKPERDDSLFLIK